MSLEVPFKPQGTSLLSIFASLILKVQKQNIIRETKHAFYKVSHSTENVLDEWRKQDKVRYLMRGRKNKQLLWKLGGRGDGLGTQSRKCKLTDATHRRCKVADLCKFRGKSSNPLNHKTFQPIGFGFIGLIPWVKDDYVESRWSQCFKIPERLNFYSVKYQIITRMTEKPTNTKYCTISLRPKKVYTA